MSDLSVQLTELYKKRDSLDVEDRKRSFEDLKALVTKDPSTEVQILWLLNLSRESIEQRDLESASLTLDEAQRIMEHAQSWEWQSELRRLRSVTLQRSGNHEEAFRLLVRAYTSDHATIDPWSLAHISLNLGVLAANGGDYDGASIYLQRCLDHAEVSEIEPHIPAHAHLVLAQAQLERGALEDAHYHARLSLKLYNELGNTARSAVAASLLASVNLERKDLEGARNVLVDISKESLPRVLLISIANLEAKLNALEGNFAAAHDKHDQAIRLASEVSTARLKENSIQLKCETYLLEQRPEAALNLLTSLEGGNEQGYTELTLHELRGKALEGIGRYREALEENKKFTKLQKDLLGERSSSALSRLRAAQEILDAEREAAHFRERSQFYAKELSQRTSYLVQQNQYINEVIDHIKTLMAKRPEVGDLLKDIGKRLRQLPAATFDWSEYLRLFDEIHPNALAILRQKYPALSEAESQICTLVLAKLSNPEIARLLAVSERTVENHRYRLRKKLEISVDVDLAHFLEQTLGEKPSKALRQ